MRASLDLLGLYRYDITIFDGLVLPDGIDREMLIDNLLLETQELELLYPAAHTMRDAITVWSARMLPIWTKLQITTTFEYNPIHNYDRHESRTVSGKNSNMVANTHADEHTDTHSETGTSSGKASDTGTSSVVGMNTVTFHPEKKDDGSSETSANTSSNGQSKIVTNGGYNDTASGEHTETETAEISGNIGVTTTQQMIEAEREVVKFDLMGYIITEFKHRFCLLVY